MIRLVVDTEFTSLPEKRLELLTVQVKFNNEDQFIEPLKHIYASENLQKYYDENNINVFKTRVDNDLIQAPFLQYLRDNGYNIVALDKSEFSDFLINNRISRELNKEVELLEVGGLLIDTTIRDNKKSYRLNPDKLEPVEIMAQFAQAEHGTIFLKDSWYFKEYIEPLCRDGVIYNELTALRGESVGVKLDYKARLTTSNYTVNYNKNLELINKPCNWLKGFIIPYLINDRLAVIRYFDTSAIFGSLKSAALRCNRKRILDIKDTFKRGTHEREHDTHISKIENAFKGMMPDVSIEEAINYAVLSDLEIDFIWGDLNKINANDDVFLTMCKSQGINIQQHLYSKINQLQDLDNKFNLIVYSEKSGKYRDNYITKGKQKIYDFTGSPKNIDDNIDEIKNSHRSLKIVLGGRANNNYPLLQPTPVFNKKSCINNFIIDTDIKSAYANSIKENILFLGKPELKNYGKKPITLKTFLKSDIYKNLYICEKTELKNSFIAEISYKDLSFNFDYFASKLNFNDISVDETTQLKEYAKGFDLDFSDIEYISQPDPQIKYFTRELINGRLTGWDIDFILNDNTITKTQRAELLNKIKISKLIYHSNSNILEFNTYCNTDIVIRNNANLFTIVDLGEIYITPNLKKRESYKSEMKKHDKNSDIYKELYSNQEHYKLLNNGLYGLLCSDISNISSVITANNITAKCRQQAYCMEKGLSMYQTITDGGTSSFKVPVFTDQGFNISNVSNSYKMLKHSKNIYNRLNQTSKFKFKNLLDPKKLKSYFKDNEKIIDYDNRIYSVNELNNVVACLQTQHLKEQFPLLKSIKSLNLELKGIFKNVSTIGTAHYYLTDLFNANDNVIKTRGYKSRILLTIKNGIVDYDVNSLHRILDDILHNAENIEIPYPQLDEKLVKLGDIRDKKTNSLLNETRYKSILVCMTTLSSFKFKSYLQFKSWDLKHESNKAKSGISFEKYFYTDDERKFVNLRATYDFLDKCISDGLTVKDAIQINKINDCREKYNMCKLDKKTFKSLDDYIPQTKLLHEYLKSNYDILSTLSTKNTIKSVKILDNDKISVCK